MQNTYHSENLAHVNTTGAPGKRRREDGRRPRHEDPHSHLHHETHHADADAEERDKRLPHTPQGRPPRMPGRGRALGS